MNCFKTYLLCAVLLTFSAPLLAHEHTHIGLNQDGIWGTADDNQLWIFATPESPSWGPIHMLPTGEFIGDKQIFEAEIDCWHSAHPGNGLFQLDFNSDDTQPDWQIGIERISFSDPTNFWIEDEATTLEILNQDGNTFMFETPDWDSELPNGSGGTGAWHFHNHTAFIALAADYGETFTASFRAIDTGSTGYTSSDVYTMEFVTVPEPLSLLLLGGGFGLVGFSRKRNRSL